MVKIWHAREAVVKVASSVTITTAAALDTFFSSGTAIQGSIKDLTLKEPESDVEKLDFHGNDTGGFQNAEVEQKPYSMAEISGTMVLPGDEQVENLFFPTGTAINATHTRYRPGTGTRKTPAFLINLDDSTDEVNFVLDACFVTVNGEVKSTGADGHFEFAFTAKCLPRNFYGPEFKD